MQVQRIKEVNNCKSHVFFNSSCWTVSQCKNLVQMLSLYRITVIKFISETLFMSETRLCCVFQTKHGFDIGIGPLLTRIHLLFELVSDRYHFFQFDAVVNRHLNWALLGRPRKRPKSD